MSYSQRELIQELYLTALDYCATKGMPFDDLKEIKIEVELTISQEMVDEYIRRLNIKKGTENDIKRRKNTAN